MKVIYAFLFFFTVRNAVCQEFKDCKVSTEILIGNGPFNGGLVPILRLKDFGLKESFVNKNRIKSYIIKQLNFQTPQYYYLKYLSGEIKWDLMADILRIYKVDTNELSKEPIRQFVKILIGENVLGEKFFAVDSNGNDLFDDETISYYFTKQNIRGADIERNISLSFEVFNKNQIIKKGINIKLYPKKSAYTYRDSVENYYYMMAQCNQHGEAKVKVGDSLYKILFSNEIPSIFYNRDNSRFIIVKVGERNSKSQTQYRLGDTIQLGKYILLIDSIDKFGEELNLKIAKKFNRNVQYGFREGELAPKIEALSTDGRQLNLDRLTSEYVLLDFWGTWCGPCRENTPGLKRLFDDYKANQLQIVGVASDKEVGVVNNYIGSEKIKWVNIFDGFDNPLLTRTYRVEIFPTYILIDSTGRIIIRAEGKEGLVRVRKFLQENINNNKNKKIKK